MTAALGPLFVGGLGPLEIGIILLLLVILFGADKIPKLARSAGDAKKEFEKAKLEASKEIEEYEEELEKEAEEEAAAQPAQESTDGGDVAETKEPETPDEEQQTASE